MVEFSTIYILFFIVYACIYTIFFITIFLSFNWFSIILISFSVYIQPSLMYHLCYISKAVKALLLLWANFLKFSTQHIDSWVSQMISLITCSIINYEEVLYQVYSLCFAVSIGNGQLLLLRITLYYLQSLIVQIFSKILKIHCI